MYLLEDLNPPQKQAVTHRGGPLLVIAGPGSGKTKTLTHRVAWLISQDVDPTRILAVTFTNKAANEMKSRINQLLDATGQESKNSHTEYGIRNTTLWIGTFHSVCLRILREQVEHSPYTSGFLIYDKKDATSLIKEISANLQIDDKQFKPQHLLGAISKAKSELITPDRAHEIWQEPALSVYKSVYESYQKRLQKNNALDFDDLLMQAVLLLQNNKNILEYYQQRFQHVLVDEYQDTNPAQYEFSKLLAQKHKNLTVVGDVDQSIYGFRNADFRNVLNLQNDFPEITTVKLEQNYRSTGHILQAADSLIQENTERLNKAIWTENEGGPHIKLIQAEDENHEAQSIIELIEQLVKTHRYTLEDFAILFRTNAQSRSLEETLIRHRFPYRLIGTTRFYERAEIKDVLAFLRLLVNPDDESSFRRIANRPPRGIGQKTLETLVPHQKTIIEKGKMPEELQLGLNKSQQKGASQLAELFKKLQETKQSQPLHELVRALINQLEFVEFLQDGTEKGESKAENVKELMGVTKDFTDNERAADDLENFLQNITLLSAQDEMQTDTSMLTLMTMHAAKGLEFPVVVISGVEEGLLPHYRSLGETEALEEERRLCYVGFTRAQKHLALSFARRRRLYGKTQANPPSRFVFSLPEEIVELAD